MRFAVFLDVEYECDRTGRVAWYLDDVHRFIAQRNIFAFLKNEVAMRTVIICVGGPIRWEYQIPIGGGGCDLRAIVFLEVCGTCEVIAMAVPEQDVFHFCGIEA